jgi:alpha-tubulin suppressor-like RCC1 family protein/predicted Ser/Thr protein kinase
MSSERASPGLSALEPSYEIVREIGRGGTSVVYLARERATNADVAIKLIHPKYLGDEEAMGRFAREARFLERLVHPNIVRVRAVLALGDAGLAIVMAHVPGRTLKELIREEGRLAPERATRFTRDIARALSAAHMMGIVHRDVKPENVFVDSSDRPLLADFGLARSMAGDSQLTMAGIAIGTPAYMAPEQIEGGALDARGDVYSLGLVAWEMLTGHRPWEGESLYAVLYSQRHAQLPDVRAFRNDVPDALADAIAVAIEKDPEVRWQNAGQMIEGLDGAAPPRRTTRQPPLSADTVRFTRPLPAAPDVERPAAAALPHDVRPPAVPVAATPNPPVRAAPPVGAALESIAAELAAQDKARVSKTRRRYYFALGGLTTLVTLVVVGAEVQGRSNDMNRTPTAVASDFAINDSAGKSLAATQTAASTPRPDSGVSSRQARPVARDSSAQKRPGITQQSTGAAKTAENVSTKAITQAEKATGKPAPEKPIPAAASAVAPVVGPSASRVTVAAGGLHSCMLNAEGRAFCWGANDRGQLGAGGASSVATPTAVAGDVRFTAIATGLSHSCAIARGGGAWCWGENERGQLGDRSTIAHQAPMRVADVRALTAIGVGAAHSCALDSQGVALCWGSNAHGQLGFESSAGETGTPSFVAGDHHYSSIALGWNFTCGLDAGRAFCWGENAAGQLGDGSTTDRRVPVSVAGSLTFRSIATGATHACGITSRGEAYCWGSNAGGQLGDGTRVNREAPTAVRTSLRFVSIATGALHTCALTAAGEAFCWGRDNFGQLGDGGNGQDSAEPVRVAGDHSFAAVRVFGSHTCATTSSGEAFCWGYNLDGQLGDGSRANRTRPVYVEPPPGT